MTAWPLRPRRAVWSAVTLSWFGWRPWSARWRPGGGGRCGWRESPVSGESDPPMLPGLTLPASLRRLLDAFAGCFTKPTLVVFTAMVVGMIAQTGSKTVCGMLAGAGLAQTWSHDRVHRFFARAVWSIDAMGLVVLDLVVTHLVDADAVIVLAVDDTAHRRRGKKVHGASWIHDGSAPSRNKLAFGHRWVVVGVVVALPFMTRPVCLPVACRRWQGKGTASTVDLSCQMVATIAARLPARRIHVVADAAYHGKQVRSLPERSPGPPACRVTPPCMAGPRNAPA